MCVCVSGKDSLFLELPAGLKGGQVCSKAQATVSSGFKPPPGRGHSNSYSPAERSHGQIGQECLGEDRIRKAFVERFEAEQENRVNSQNGNLLKAVGGFY